MSRLESILGPCRLGIWSWLDGRVEWDETNRLLFDRAESPTDYPAYLECIHPDDRQMVDSNIQRFIREGRYEDIEHRIALSDGRVRWVFARGVAVFDAAGELRGLRGIALDITDIKEREEQLAREAETDVLTGLRNRRWLVQEGPREVARCERGAAPFSLMYIDVDDFKRVNDSLGGHEAGDRFLVGIVARIKPQLRSGDVLARVGGDELVALLPETSADEADAIAHRTTQIVASQTIGAITPRVSVGVSTWVPGEDFYTVLRHSDRAMYRVKASRKRTSDAIL